MMEISDSFPTQTALVLRHEPFPYFQWTDELVIPSAGLDLVTNRETSDPAWPWTHSNVQLVILLIELSWHNETLPNLHQLNSAQGLTERELSLTSFTHPQVSSEFTTCITGYYIQC
jgi:hypothetical protein